MKPHYIILLFLLVSVTGSYASADSENKSSQKVITAPLRNSGGKVIDGSGTEQDLQSRNGKVSISTVAISTLAMAAATGLGAVPFFFVDLDPHWSGICNGMAAGVMLAASFDLIQEGQDHGSGIWAVVGILSGGIFISLCKKILDRHGDVSMLDIKGADAAKAFLVVGIMTLHSFGEGAGVGVSFAGSKGILVTLAIAVHNIPEGLAVSMVLSSKGVSPQKAMIWSVITSLPQPIVAVPSFLFADAFHKLLPFATGFAAGCMVWMVVAEVLPDGFKEASPSHVASAATLSVAFMEGLSFFFHGFSFNTSGVLVSLLFGFGPLLGGVSLVSFALSFHLQHLLLTSVSSGIAFVLSLWRPFQLLFSSKMEFSSLITLLLTGFSFSHFSTSHVLKLGSQKRTSASSLTGFSLSRLTLQSVLCCLVVALHALAEGLALGVAAPKAYGLGQHMVLPVSLHGLPRGAAVASCIFGATDSWHGSLFAAGLIGFVGPLSAIGAILAGIDYSGLDHVMMLACGALLPCFWSIVRRAARLDRRQAVVGFIIGSFFAGVCLTFTKLVCFHTPYCNSAPEAVR